MEIKHGGMFRFPRRGNGLVFLLLALLLLAVSGCQVKNEPPAPLNPVAADSEIEAVESPDAVLTEPRDGEQANADISSTETAKALGEEPSDGSPADKTVAAQEGPAKGDGADDGQTPGTVSLLITRDYGRQNLFEKSIPLQTGWSILDVLKSGAEVNTKWDGGFVHGIDGLNATSGGLTGKNSDWFYYINGICADVGACEYTMRAGEKVWWDYHAWGSTGLTNPAVVGCYPEPFVHGYRGQTGVTTVMSSDENAALARAVIGALKSKGVAAAECMTLNDELLKNRPGPIIVLGTWDELKQLPWLDAFNKSFRKNGTSVHFTDDKVELLDFNGKVQKNCGPNTGVICASAAGLGNHKVMWLLAGTDKDGLENAVNILTAHPEQLNGSYHLAVISGQVLRLPLQ